MQILSTKPDAGMLSMTITLGDTAKKLLQLIANVAARIVGKIKISVL